MKNTSKECRDQMFNRNQVINLMLDLKMIWKKMEISLLAQDLNILKLDQIAIIDTLTLIMINLIICYLIEGK